MSEDVMKQSAATTSRTESRLHLDHKTLAKLGGKELQPNRGIPLNLDWVENVRVNTSAIERRAQTLVTRRTVKKEWQIAWHKQRAGELVIEQRSAASETVTAAKTSRRQAGAGAA